jgi:hypothetical protein
MEHDSAAATRGRRHGRDAYRRLFLASVAEHRHHVLDDLAEVVLPSYRELMAEWPLLDANTRLRQHPWLWPPSTPDPPAEPWHTLWDVLALWRRRSHLYAVVTADESSLDLRAGSDWITDAALDTLERWWRAGGTTGRWELADERIPGLGLRIFAAARFHPREEPDDYRERTMRELARQVAAEIRDSTEMHRTWGLFDTTREKRVQDLHAAWTARYQVPTANGRYEGYERIAADATNAGDGIGYRSVKSAIEDFTADIGLAKRRGKPGRPANSEGSP